METPSSSSQSEAAATRERIVAAQNQRFRWKLTFDKHILTFCVRAVFGFLLAAFCAGCLIYLMIMRVSGSVDECTDRTSEFTSMFFSLLSFAAGYFLGASPSVKRVRRRNQESSSPGILQRIETAAKDLISPDAHPAEQGLSNFPPDTPQVNFSGDENNV